MGQTVHVAQVQEAGHTLDGVERPEQIVDAGFVLCVALHLQQSRLDGFNVFAGLLDERLEKLLFLLVEDQGFRHIRRLVGDGGLGCGGIRLGRLGRCRFDDDGFLCPSARRVGRRNRRVCLALAGLCIRSRVRLDLHTAVRRHRDDCLVQGLHPLDHQGQHRRRILRVSQNQRLQLLRQQPRRLPHRHKGRRAGGMRGVADRLRPPVHLGQNGQVVHFHLGGGGGQSLH